jgi:hypothetical protein
MGALQAVGGVATGGARLSVAADRLDLGGLEQGRISIANVGGEALDWTATLGGPAAARITIDKAAGRLDAGAADVIGIRVDRQGLDDGTYDATLEIVGADATHVVTILFRVGEDVLPDVGTVQILTVRYDHAGKLVSGGETTTDVSKGYRFNFVTQPGPWFLMAMVDKDGDGQLAGSDLLGFWPNNAQPQLIEARNGELRARLELVLEPVGLEPRHR